MAKVKQHDTWPPLYGHAEDETGLLDLTTADSLKFIANSGTHAIEGAALPVNPPVSMQVDGKPVDMNWRYVWAAGDTDFNGTYKVELEITWDAGTTPPQVQTVPNDGTDELIIEVDQG